MIRRACSIDDLFTTISAKHLDDPVYPCSGSLYYIDKT